jgi:hypothetical protein
MIELFQDQQKNINIKPHPTKEKQTDDYNRHFQDFPILLLSLYSYQIHTLTWYFLFVKFTNDKQVNGSNNGDWYPAYYCQPGEIVNDPEVGSSLCIYCRPV